MVSRSDSEPRALLTACAPPRRLVFSVNYWVRNVTGRREEIGPILSFRRDSDRWRGGLPRTRTSRRLSPISQSGGLQPPGEKGARCSPADSNRDLRRFKGRASAVGLGEQNGATGPIRTDTARGLKPLPPTNWATVALVRAAGCEPALFTTSR